MHPLAGIYAAAVSPLGPDGELDLASVPALLRFLAEQGAHGALLGGTTGEGASLNDEERLALFSEAQKVRERFPEFRLLAGTGTPSLSQTISLSHKALDLGCDAVVVLPPYYLRGVPQEGLFQWYAQVVESAVRHDDYLLAYHIPQITGVELHLDLLKRLSDAYPNRFAGIKDSTGDLQHSQAAIRALPGKAILVGNDHLIGPALKLGSAGAITALGNLRVAASRRIWELYEAGEDYGVEQSALSRSRAVLDANPSAPAFLKALLPQLFDLPQWSVRLPLLPFDKAQAQKAFSDFKASLDE